MEFGATYHLETTDQFWAELDDTLNINPLSPLQDIDFALRSTLAFVAAYHDQFLSDPQAETLCAHHLLLSPIYIAHPDRLTDLVISSVLHPPQGPLSASTSAPSGSAGLTGPNGGPLSPPASSSPEEPWPSNRLRTSLSPDSSLDGISPGVGEMVPKITASASWRNIVLDPSTHLIVPLLLLLELGRNTPSDANAAFPQFSHEDKVRASVEGDFPRTSLGVFKMMRRKWGEVVGRLVWCVREREVEGNNDLNARVVGDRDALNETEDDRAAMIAMRKAERERERREWRERNETRVAGLAVTLLYEICRAERSTMEELGMFSEEFISHLFELVERTRYVEDETFNYSLIRLIIALNEQFMVASLPFANSPPPPSTNSGFPPPLPNGMVATPSTPATAITPSNTHTHTHTHTHHDRHHHHHDGERHHQHHSHSPHSSHHRVGSKGKGKEEPSAKETNEDINTVLKVLKLKMRASKTFGENLIWILNRSSAGDTPEDLCVSLLILKILYLLFTTPGTHDYFYTNDLCVLVDIFVRELGDLPEESEGLRHTYLRVLHPLLTQTQLRERPYKRPQIHRLLVSLIDNKHRFREIDSTTKRLVQRNLKAEWCKELENLVSRPTTTSGKENNTTPSIDTSVSSPSTPSSKPPDLVPPPNIATVPVGKTGATAAMAAMASVPSGTDMHLNPESPIPSPSLGTRLSTPGSPPPPLRTPSPFLNSFTSPTTRPQSMKVVPSEKSVELSKTHSLDTKGPSSLETAPSTYPSGYSPYGDGNSGYRQARSHVDLSLANPGSPIEEWDGQQADTVRRRTDSTSRSEGTVYSMVSVDAVAVEGQQGDHSQHRPTSGSEYRLSVSSSSDGTDYSYSSFSNAVSPAAPVGRLKAEERAVSYHPRTRSAPNSPPNSANSLPPPLPGYYDRQEPDSRSTSPGPSFMADGKPRRPPPLVPTRKSKKDRDLGVTTEAHHPAKRAATLGIDTLSVSSGDSGGTDGSRHSIPKSPARRTPPPPPIRKRQAPQVPNRANKPSSATSSSIRSD